MPIFFSDHFSTGLGITSLPAHAVKTPHGINGGNIKISNGRISDPSDAMAAADVLRFLQLPSAARIWMLYIITDGVFSAGTMDVGLHLAGNNHDGAVKDIDLFDAAFDINAAAARTEAFAAAVLEDDDRGRPLWENLAEGAGSDTSDPNTTYEVTGTINGAIAGAGALEVEVWWTQDDG